MKNLLEKGKKTLTNINFEGVRKYKLAMSLFTFLMVMTLGNVNVYANGMGALDNAVELILTALQSVGIIISIFGIVQLIISVTQDNPQAKLNGTYALLAGIGMVSIELILSALGLV